MARPHRECASAHAQVQDPRIHALPPLRPRARRVSQVRRLPDLPARARPRRLHPRDDQVQLVASMSMTDPTADFLTRIRNGLAAAARDRRDPPPRGSSASSRGSSRSRATSRATTSRRPTRDRAGEHVRDRACATPRTRKPVISGLRRVSRPGRRTYVDSTHIPKVQGGMGTTIVSTSSGVMTGHDARTRGHRRRGRGGGLVRRA